MSRSLVDSLQAIADVLAKFAEQTPAGALRWDGKAYAPAAFSPGDVHAAKWWGMLTAISGLLAAQRTPLSPGQIDYLDRLLFGGMGSLNDFQLDQKRLGPSAVAANQELDRLRSEMYAQFHRHFVAGRR